MSSSSDSRSDEPAALSDGPQEGIYSADQSLQVSTSPAPRTLSQREASAFLAWVKAVLPAPAEQLKQPEDLADGVALFEVLASVDAAHFLNPHAQTGEATGENYALKLGTLKRLYKLMMQYYTETLLLSPSPACADADLNEIARSSSAAELCKFCKLAIGITIQSEATKAEHVLAIQTLAQQDQQSLMVVIEEVMSGQSSIASPPASSILPSSGGEAERAEMQRLRAQHADLQKLYLALMEDHQTLKASQEDSQNEKEELAKEVERLQAEKQSDLTTGAAAALKVEVAALKDRLRKSEDQLAELESEVERLTALDKETSTKIHDLQKRAEEATKLKDEVDEYRHLADRVQRTENANEKYRKKLEEMAGVRRHLKELEDQNSELIDRNASLEKEHAKVLEYKPLIENYKEQIADLTRRNGSLTEETETLRYNLEQSALQLKGLEEARTRSAEEIELYREKVEELELEVNGSVSEGKDGSDVPLDDELEDTLRGTTMTDLKLRIHQLSRDLKAAKNQSGEGSNVLVLENLLEDSQRMKQRYEADYWKEYRLRLQRDGELDKIRSGGEGSIADGPEAARALRLQLAEVITDLDSLRVEHAELSVKHESNEKELASVRADLILVDKDKLDILASLRSTVSQEKAELEEEIKTLQQDLRSAQELEKSMGSQIQGLLMDKISLMEVGAAGRTEAPAGEPSFSSAEQEGLDARNKELEIRLSDLEDKMRKAKAFIRQQDKLLQEARKGAATQNGGLENGAGAKADEELRRENSTLKQEQALMLSAFHHLSSTRTNKNLGISASLHPGAVHAGMSANGGSGPQGGGQGGGGGGGTVLRLGCLAAEASAPPPKSWLGQQKRKGTGLGWVLGRR